jgi:nucleoside-diphosphate-sugar epimerase
MKRTVFITGAASGAGAVTPAAASHGIPITLDVTDCDSCAAAAREVAAHTDGLGAVINFAGLLDLGPLMEVSEERLRRVFDVNVIETHRVNGAIFDLVRAGGGQIVNISSESVGSEPASPPGTSAREEKHARDRRSWRAPYIARSPAGAPSPNTWSMEECRAELWTFCQGRWLTRSSSWGRTCGRVSRAVLKCHQPEVGIGIGM